MKEQFQHKLTTSFFLWFDNFLLNKGEAYSNKTGEFFYYSDPRVDSAYKVYGSPFKQWVTDSSITGATMPTGVYIDSSFSGRDDGVVLDFENGRALVSGSNTGLSLTGQFSVKDFNVYMTNDTEEDLVVENKYTVNSRLPSGPYTYIEPYDDVVPAIFISSSDAQNKPFNESCCLSRGYLSIGWSFIYFYGFCRRMSKPYFNDGIPHHRTGRLKRGQL